MDSFSKWCEAFSTKSQDAFTVANILYKEIFSRYGAPKTLISDRGKSFMNQLVDAVCEIYSVKTKHTSRYHPQTNSTCERYNSFFEQSIRCYIDKKSQNNWPDLLPGLLMAYRRSPVARLAGYSPFSLLFGKEMLMPIETQIVPKQRVGKTYRQYLTDLLDILNVSRQEATESKENAQAKDKARFDKTAKEPTFKVGDTVLMKNHKTEKGLTLKLADKYTGPYYILQEGPHFTYVLAKPGSHQKLRTIVNASELAHYKDPSDRLLNTTGTFLQNDQPNPAVDPDIAQPHQDPQQDNTQGLNDHTQQNNNQNSQSQMQAPDNIFDPSKIEKIHSCYMFRGQKWYKVKLREERGTKRVLESLVPEQMKKDFHIHKTMSEKITTKKSSASVQKLSQSQ